MYSYTLAKISSYSVFIAVILTLIRYKNIPNKYLPFLIFIWIGLANEVLSDFFIKAFHSNAVNSNIYVLFEFIVILWQFYQWNKNHLRTYIILAIIGLVMWIGDNFIIYSIKTFNPFFRVYYSGVIVYLSIIELNKLLMSNEKKILYNDKFIICISFILFFSYRATFEIYFLVPLKWSIDFYGMILTIFIFLNLLSNILYALAVICIPKKQKFILKY